MFAVYVIRLGAALRAENERILELCGPQDTCDLLLGQFQAAHQNTLLFQAAGLGLALALVGTFWGAPLVARELEAGTHRVVWNQSVTRRRWWTVKLAVVTAAAVLTAGVATILLTWAAAPVDDLADNHFSTVLFGARNLAPVGYAVFAVALGTVIGLLTRRTLPAMALTFVLFLVAQFAVPNLIRPHLL
jgi:ABC-type transport system involved in multi-copper enzyme maturation permease subunit